jgi:hypothetical protein
MEMGDKNYIDMITTGYFRFDKDDLGYFQFGVVEGQIDYRVEKIGGDEPWSRWISTVNVSCSPQAWG